MMLITSLCSLQVVPIQSLSPISFLSASCKTSSGGSMLVLHSGKKRLLILVKLEASIKWHLCEQHSIWHVCLLNCLVFVSLLLWAARCASINWNRIVFVELHVVEVMGSFVSPSLLLVMTVFHFVFGALLHSGQEMCSD